MFITGLMAFVFAAAAVVFFLDARDLRDFDEYDEASGAWMLAAGCLIIAVALALATWLTW